MRSVWKYLIPVLGTTHATFQMPYGAEVVAVGVDPLQQTSVAIWVEVDSDVERGERTFQVVGTGHRVPDHHDYRGTVTMGALVLHVYEQAGTIPS